MNMERNRMKACLCPAVVEVVCVSVCPCMSHCVVFILKEQLLIKMVIISGCSHPRSWVASGKHGVVYAFSLGLRARFDTWLLAKFSTLATLECTLSSFHCLFFPVCVFVRFSYAEQVFNNLILQIVIHLLSQWHLESHTYSTSWKRTAVKLTWGIQK